MSTQLAKQEDLNQISVGLQSFEARKEETETLAQSATSITVTDLLDKAQIGIVTDKRKELKAARVKIQNEGKAMRDLITPISKLISSKEKELVAIIEPEEERLEGLEYQAKEAIEKERQKAIDEENARIQKRIDLLAEFGYQIDYSDIKSMSDDTFAKYLDAAWIQFEKEQAEKAEEDRLRKEAEEREERLRQEEAKRIEEERAELIRLRAEQEETARQLREAQEKIDAENKRIEEEKRKIDEDFQKEKQRIEREKELKSCQATG